MKKVVTMLMVLGLFASISFAQQQEKKGLGFEFHMFPSTLMSGEGGGALDVYFPIETTGGLLIEPSLSYYSYSSDTDYDDSSYGGPAKISGMDSPSAGEFIHWQQLSLNISIEG